MWLHTRWTKLRLNQDPRVGTARRTARDLWIDGNAPSSAHLRWRRLVDG
jgi:hypothetical protein